MLKSQPNRPGPASADLGLAGRASARPGLGPTRPGLARPAGPEKKYFFLIFLMYYFYAYAYRVDKFRNGEAYPFRLVIDL